MTHLLLVQCLHCNGDIEIEAINCGVFRHASHKDKTKKINMQAKKK